MSRIHPRLFTTKDIEESHAFALRVHLVSFVVIVLQSPAASDRSGGAPGTRGYFRNLGYLFQNS